MRSGVGSTRHEIENLRFSNNGTSSKKEKKLLDGKVSET